MKSSFCDSIEEFLPWRLMHISASRSRVSNDKTKTTIGKFDQSIMEKNYNKIFQSKKRNRFSASVTRCLSIIV